MKKIITMFLIHSLFLQTSFAEISTARTMRYLSMASDPLILQEDSLQQTYSIHFPQESVKTLRDAIHYLVSLYGYTLVNTTELPTNIQYKLSQPLLEAHRTLHHVTLAQGLDILLGDAFQAVIDPVNRQISLQAKKSQLNNPKSQSMHIQEMMV